MRVLLFLMFLFLAAQPLFAGDSCVSCHKGIEQVSSAHTSPCTTCHGGNPKAAHAAQAHAGMYGKNNPSKPEAWDKSCAQCHPLQVARVKSTIMYTNTGIIKNTALAWGEQDEPHSATRSMEGYDAAGNRTAFTALAERKGKAADLNRKLCGVCHIGYEKHGGGNTAHGAGCAACHYRYNSTVTYSGSDKAMQGREGHPETHAMDALPGDDACFRCHNRSGRIALSYSGLLDGANALVPTKNGNPGPVMTSGGRNLNHIKADIHKDFGMECIDCHTSRDIMGDGYFYENMYDQVEIRCEDCHGSGTQKPRAKKAVQENSDPLRESRSYARPVRAGDWLVLTRKGRMYPNVYMTGETVTLVTKRKGRVLTVKQATGRPEHLIAGHERMSCVSCHSRAVPQCYGCHTSLDRERLMPDPIKRQMTPGFFSETEDLRTIAPFPLGIDQRGEIVPVTPGCQTFLHDENGVSLLPFRGKRQYKFAPFYSHNTGKKAVSCTECHGNPQFAGFGQAVVSPMLKNIGSTLLCDTCDKPLDALAVMEKGGIKPLGTVVRDGAKPLETKAVQKLFNANKCIVCHDTGEKRIYGKAVDYSVLDDAVHRPLLGGKRR